MKIDFHSESIAGSYASRTADEGWMERMRAITDPHGKVVADIGCGGGIYSRAWSDLGAARVLGIDFSARMVADATAASGEYPTVSFTEGDATNTGLPDASVDIVFERALIHHLPDLAAAFAEAKRILKPGGMLVVQDRTIEDVMRPASPEHVRGYFFEAFPRLLDVERERRPDTHSVVDAMRDADFGAVTTHALNETRRVYGSAQELEADLRSRTGRSILHELDDAEMETLIQFIGERVAGSFPVHEADHWTIWTGTSEGT